MSGRRRRGRVLGSPHGRGGSGVSMDTFVIHGGPRLKGLVEISGSKNAALPILAAALLADGPSILRHVPDLADIRHMAVLLGELGAEVERDESGAMTLRVADESKSHARYDLVRKMRASICVLGPLLAKRGQARVAMPGGCAIGSRPIDLHMRGLRALGAELELDGGDIVAKAEKLRGATVFLGGRFGSTVLGTANVMMAAALAEGRTIIESAACEPEIADLANYLNEMGAKVEGGGTPRVTVDGVESLRGTEHEVIPDRIEAGTFMVAAAVTNGEIRLNRCRLDHMLAVVDKLREIGVMVEEANGGALVASAHPSAESTSGLP